jgi:hypothetical protein
VHPELEERVRALSDTYDLTLAQVVETALDSLLASGREERAYVATLGLPEARDEYETVVGLPPSAGALEVATRLRMAARSAIAEDRARLAKRRP